MPEPDPEARQAAREAELAPCPWCDQPPYVYVQEADFPSPKGGWKQQVWCTACGIVGPRADTEAEAVAAWNHRPAILAAEQRARREALEEAARVADGAAEENILTGASYGSSSVLAQKYSARANEAEVIASAIRQLGGDDAR